MIKLIHKWKQFILKNFPVLWMSGLHLIILITIPISALGYLFGNNLELTTSLEDVFTKALVTSLIFLVVIVAWQYFRFRREVTFWQLLKYYMLCLLTYGFVIMAFCSPALGFNKKLDAVGEKAIETDLAKYQTYIWANALLPFYEKDSCNFKEWQRYDPGALYYSRPEDLDIDQLKSKCPRVRSNFHEFVYNANEAIDSWNFLARYLLYDRLRENTTDEERVEINNIALKQLKNERDSAYSKVFKKPKTLSRFSANNKKSRENLENQQHEKISERSNTYLSNEVRISAINEATALVLAAQRGHINSSFLDEVNISPIGLRWEIEDLVSMISDESNTATSVYRLNKNQKNVIGDFRKSFQRIIRNIQNNYSKFNDEEGVEVFLLFFVIIAVLSSLIITARFKIEAMLSPLVAYITWMIYYYFFGEVLGLSDNFDSLYLLAFLAILLIVIYWIRNHKIKSINVLRALLLHVVNLSFVFVLCIVYVFLKEEFYDYNYKTDYTLQLKLVIVMAVVALLFNVLFLYQYHRHLRLPLKNK